MTDLGTLGGDYSSAYGINASGQVVGFAAPTGDDNDTSGEGWHAFLYSGSKMTDLGTLDGGTGSYAYAINDSGQVVGNSFSTDYAGQHDFLYSNGTMTDLNALIDPSSGWTLQNANGINDAGQIVRSWPE